VTFFTEVWANQSKSIIIQHDLHMKTNSSAPKIESFI
jgi:hypothetical protein